MAKNERNDRLKFAVFVTTLREHLGVRRPKHLFRCRGFSPMAVR